MRWITGFGLLGSTAYLSLYYIFPELRPDKHELLSAGIRLLRITSTSVRIASSYSLFGVSPEQHEVNSKRLFDTLKKNGGSYIKLGQAISQLDLLVPFEYSDTMKPLQNEAPRSEFERIKSIIEEDLRVPVDSLFADFDPVPIASASIAQVHKAKLHDGQIVAVKVQHKWAKQQYPGDVKVLRALANLGKKLFSDFDYTWIIEDMDKSTTQELDFRIEAKNAVRCHQIFANNPMVKVPGIYSQLSSERVITMEFVDGICMNDLEAVKALGVPLKDLAQTLTSAFAEMIFTHGFVHCDPHPGNIMVRNVPFFYFWKRPQVVLLDHGLYKNLDDGVKESYKGMWKCILTKDEAGMQKHAIELGVTEMFPLFAGMMVGRTWEDIMDSDPQYKLLSNPRASEVDKSAIRSHALQWQSEINWVLRNMNQDLVLIFKTFEWLMSIDAALGTPVHFVGIMAKYCLDDNLSLMHRIFIRVGIWFYGLFMKTS